MCQNNTHRKFVAFSGAQISPGAFKGYGQIGPIFQTPKGGVKPPNTTRGWFFSGALLNSRPKNWGKKGEYSPETPIGVPPRFPGFSLGNCVFWPRKKNRKKNPGGPSPPLVFSGFLGKPPGPGKPAKTHPQRVPNPKAPFGERGNKVGGPFPLFASQKRNPVFLWPLLGEKKRKKVPGPPQNSKFPRRPAKTGGILKAPLGVFFSRKKGTAGGFGKRKARPWKGPLGPKENWGPFPLGENSLAHPGYFFNRKAP